MRVQKVRQDGRLYEYVHLVEGYRDSQGKVRHRVVANLGRRDHLKASGALDNLAAAFTRLDPLPGRFLCGALPLVVPVLRRLDLRGIVDRACPMRGRAHLTHGEVVEALLANRLTSPRPLYDVQGWAERFAANAWLGTPSGLLNDDRLGRALDALAGQLDEVTGALGMAAIAAFGVDAARLHWDFTSVAFCGEYAHQDESSPRIGFGHSSDRQSHRRQLKVAQAVTATGVPLYHRVVSGARHEGAQTHELLERLRGLAAPKRLLLVADSALVSNDNLAACERAQMQFIARLPRSYGYEETALALEPDRFSKLTYCSERARRLPLSKRPTFKGAEGNLNICVDGVNLNLRVLYVIGSEERQAARKSRTRLLAKAEQSLERIANGIAGRPAKDLEKLQRRVAKAVAAGRVGDLLRTELNDDGSQLQWRRDEDAVTAAERRDGLYALITNLPLSQASASRVLKLYKDQFIVERTHHFMKGPLLVRPVFLHSNRRAAALVAICSYAVMVYGLIESTVRNEISPRRTIAGLLPEGRTARPTAPNIFRAFSGIGFQRVRTRDGLQELPDPLTAAQSELLSILGVDSILPPNGQYAPS
ncbi:MAG: IS1634 family transposase [Candidatus Dormibacteria bacterium]